MQERILFIMNEWNPIDIHPLLKDEYQYEVKRILDGIQEDSQSIEHTSDVIYNVLKDSFGDMFLKSKEECKRIAEKLI